MLAAVRAYAGTLTGHVPDTGSLGGDVLAVLRELAERMQSIGIDVAIGLFSELEDVPEDTGAVVPTALQQVIGQARERGEVGDGPVPEAVLAMPARLLRHSMIAERVALSDEALEQIAYQLFVPLVRHHASL